MRREQETDPQVRRIYEELCDDPKSALHVAFCVLDNVLYRHLRDDFEHRLVIVVPKSLREQILRVGHDSGVNCHLGMAKTCQNSKNFLVAWHGRGNQAIRQNM